MDISSLIENTKCNFKILFNEKEDVSFLNLQEYISASIYATIWNKGISNLRKEFKIN